LAPKITPLPNFKYWVFFHYQVFIETLLASRDFFYHLESSCAVERHLCPRDSGQSLFNDVSVNVDIVDVDFPTTIFKIN
jgi:hypothetical protein